MRFNVKKACQTLIIDDLAAIGRAEAASELAFSEAKEIAVRQRKLDDKATSWTQPTKFVRTQATTTNATKPTKVTKPTKQLHINMNRSARPQGIEEAIKKRIALNRAKKARPDHSAQHTSTPRSNKKTPINSSKADRPNQSAPLPLSRPLPTKLSSSPPPLRSQKKSLS